jgi:hypothetical protein
MGLLIDPSPQIAELDPFALWTVLHKRQLPFEHRHIDSPAPDRRDIGRLGYRK